MNPDFANKVELVALTVFIAVTPLVFFTLADRNSESLNQGEDIEYTLGINIGDRFTIEITEFNVMHNLAPWDVTKGVGTQIHYQIEDFVAETDPGSPDYDGGVYEYAIVKQLGEEFEYYDSGSVRYDGRHPDPLFLHTDWAILESTLQNTTFSFYGNYKHFNILFFNVSNTDQFIAEYIINDSLNGVTIHSESRYDKITGLRTFLYQDFESNHTNEVEYYNFTLQLVDYIEAESVNSLSLPVIPIFVAMCLILRFRKNHTI